MRPKKVEKTIEKERREICEKERIYLRRERDSRGEWEIAK